MISSRKLSLACVLMIVVGLLLSGIGYLLGGRVWGVGLNLNGVWVNSPNVQERRGYRYVKTTEELEAFTGIDAELDFGDLIIEPSDHYGISYCLSEDCSFEMKVEKGVLHVVRKSYPTLGTRGELVVVGMGSVGSMENEYVKIFIPMEAEFDSVRLTAESGEVSAENFRAKSFNAESDFGNVQISGIQCDQAEIELGSGDLALTDFGEGALTIRNEFGAVKLTQVTCGVAAITADSGEIILNAVTAEDLNVQSSFGDVTGEDVRANEAELVLESGSCEMERVDIPALTVRSEFGNVSLQLVDEVTAYTLDLDTEFGDVKVDKQDMGSTYRSLETHEKRLCVFCDSGDIRIKSGDGR